MPDATKKLVLGSMAGAVAITPLCLLPGVFLSHDVVPKAIVILACAAALLFSLTAWSAGWNVLRTGRWGKWFLLLAAAQVVSLLLSTLFSDPQGLSLAGTVWRRFGAVEQIATLTIAVAAGCAAALDNLWPRSLFRAISVAGAIASVYAILQYFRIDPLLDPSLYAIQMFGGIVRPPSTMGHAIYLAAWLAPVAAIAASEALSDSAVWWQRIHAASALLCCVAVLVSGSRGGVLAFAAAAAVLAVRSGRRKQIGIGLASVCAVAVLFVLSPAGKNFRSRLVQWRQDPCGPRLLLWTESPSLMFQHPVFGTGPETFAVEFRKIESIQMSRAYPDFYQETPHNVLIDAGASQGLPGLLILVALFVLGLRAARPGIQAAIVGILVASMFASFTLVESMYLWVLVAIAVAPEKASRKKAPLRAWPRWTMIPAVATGGVFLVLALILGVTDAADKRVLTAVAKKDFASASAAFDTAMSWSHGVPGYELFLSREMATLGRALGDTPDGAAAWKDAAQASAVATQNGEERFSAAFQSSLLAIAASDLPGAEADARQTIVLAPNWYKPHLLLAQILQAGGRNAEAASEQRIAIDLKPAPQ